MLAELQPVLVFVGLYSVVVMASVLAFLKSPIS